MVVLMLTDAYGANTHVKVRAVCAERCKHGSWEGGTCDPVRDDRLLLYRKYVRMPP